MTDPSLVARMRMLAIELTLLVCVLVLPSLAERLTDLFWYREI
jgi:hypothetical protein